MSESKSNSNSNSNSTFISQAPRGRGWVRRLAEATLKYRWLILLANLAVVALVFAAMGKRGKEFGEYVAYMAAVRENPRLYDSTRTAPKPIFNADYHVWFDKDDPELQAFDKLQRIFAKEDLALVAVTSKSGDLFTNENLATLRRLTGEFWTVPYVNRVDGLVNFNYTTPSENELAVDDFIATLPLPSTELKSKKALALSDPFISQFFLSKDAAVTQVALRVIAPPEFPEAHRVVKAKLDSLLATARAGNPDLEFRMGGTVIMNNAFNEFAEKDSKTLMPLMFLFIFLLLTFLLRSVWGTVLPMGMLVTSMLFPIALFVGLMGYSLNNASVNVTQILVSVAIADSVHLLSVFYGAIRRGMGKREAILHSMEVNFVPCLVTWANTAIGFYSLMLQGIPPFRDLGLFAGTGTTYAFLATVFTLPALLSLLPVRKRAPKEEPLRPGAAMDLGRKDLAWRLVHAVDSYKRPIIAASAVLTVAALAFIPRIQVDSHAVNYFAKDSEFRKATEYVDSAIIGTNPYEFGFDAGEAGGVYDPVFLKKIERFQNHVKANPDYQITQVSSIVDVVKRLNQTLHGGDPAYYAIPDRDSVTPQGDTLKARSLIAQYVLLYTLSLPQGMDLTNQVDIHARMARVTAFQREVPSSRQAATADSLNAWLAREMPELKSRASGVTLMFAGMMNMGIPGMLKGMGLSLSLITLLLILTFRSVKAGLLSLVPNVWPIVVMYGIIGATGYLVNMSVAIVGMITLGIAVDDTVHFMMHYLAGVRRGLDRRNALIETFRLTGRAITFTTIILIAGFLTLTLSDFALNVDLGKFCALVWALGLLSEFTLLPAIILSLGKQEPATDAVLSREAELSYVNK